MGKFSEIVSSIVASMGETRPISINSGNCEEFAHKLADQIGGKVLYDDDEGHCFVEKDGYYYDAETPDGVFDYHQLPFYKRLSQ